MVGKHHKYRCFAFTWFVKIAKKSKEIRSVPVPNPLYVFEALLNADKDAVQMRKYY